MVHEKFVEKIRTHILILMKLFFQNLASYEAIHKNVAQKTGTLLRVIKSSILVTGENLQIEICNI